MNFDHFEYVLAIAKFGNLTKAAEHLFISQSALTKSMNRLEYELGVKLFDRLSSPIRLTGAGEYFATEAEKLLSHKDLMEKNLQEFSEFKQGKITVGMGPGRSEYWLPHILAEFWKWYPDIKVKVITGGMEFLEKELTERRLDLCFLSLPEFSCELFNYDLIKEERLLLSVPPNHSVLTDLCISEHSFGNPVILNPAQLNRQHFLSAPRHHGITLSLHRLIDRFHIVPADITPFTSIDLAYALSAEGLGIAYIFETCAHYPGYYKQPVFCTIGEKPEMSAIMAAWHKKDAPTMLVRAFVQITKEVIQTCHYLNA